MSFVSYGTHNFGDKTLQPFKYKTKLVVRTPNNNNILDAEVVVPLKYLSNFCRSLE